jgi:hypothetical protein
MSEYYLADDLARKRERERERSKQSDTLPMQAQDVKVTLLGDFLITSSEPTGFDPYNSTQGKPTPDVWKARRNRR